MGLHRSFPVYRNYHVSAETLSKGALAVSYTFLGELLGFTGRGEIYFLDPPRGLGHCVRPGHISKQRAKRRQRRGGLGSGFRALV